VKERIWQCGAYRLGLNEPRVMGILNVTPDSFSDGGDCFDPAVAIARGLAMIEEGADILDIGGESTRPGATPVLPEEELRRVLPVVRGLAARCRVPLSVDTLHPDVARAAIAAGASIVNATGWQINVPEWTQVLVEHRVGVCIMHTPEMARLEGFDPASETTCAGDVSICLAKALRCACEAGVNEEQCVLDPGLGLGFGKTTTQNLAILARLELLTQLGPVLIGASRKRFVGEICCESEPRQRLGGSVAVAVWSALHGAAVVRVHDVKATVHAVRMVTRLRTVQATG
jgi:dihydropteroate synthase